MGTNISIYLSDAALAKLDAAVAQQAAIDRADGLSGRKITCRSSMIEQLMLDKGNIRGMAVLDFQEELSARLNRPVDVVTTAGASKRFPESNRLKGIKEECPVLFWMK